MNKRLLGIIIAIACGSFIGGFLALQMGQYFWWVGVLAGGFIGYVAYEPKEIIRSVKAVVQEDAFAETLRKAAKESFWGGVLMSTLASLFAVWVIYPALLFGWYIKAEHQELSSLQLFVQLPLVFWFGGIAFGFMLASVVFGCSRIFLDNTSVGIHDARVYGERYGSLRESAVLTLLFFNPLTAPFYWVPIGAFQLVKLGCRAAVLVHTEERLLTMVYAAIGAAIGFAFGNPLIGLVAGVGCGVFTFQAISKRLLKQADTGNPVC